MSLVPFSLAAATSYWTPPVTVQFEEKEEQFIFKAKDFSCALSLTTSFLGGNPLPLLWGASDCFMKVQAAPQVLRPIPNYQSKWNQVNYQFPNDTFWDPDGGVLSYTSTMADGSALPSYLKFYPSERTLKGDVQHIIRVRVTAKNQQNEEAHSDFDLKVDAARIMTTVLGGMIGLVLLFILYANIDKIRNYNPLERIRLMTAPSLPNYSNLIKVQDPEKGNINLELDEVKAI